MKEFFKNRYNLLMVIAGLLATVLIFQVVNLQVLKSEYYTAVANSRGYSTKRLDAPRGEIVDKYGRIIAGNTTVQIVSIVDRDLDEDQFNKALYNLIELSRRIGKPYEDSLPIDRNNNVAFTFDSKEKEHEKMEHWLGGDFLLQYEMSVLLQSFSPFKKH